uniref:Delta-like protein n=1 Tax=Enterobius vermicularis TaxID=51028 RepID=A0A0N4V5D1_ENTVE
LEYCTRHKPCKNGASCQNGGPGNYTSYTCNCFPGYSGKHCEIKLDGCPVFRLRKALPNKHTKSCQNGGLCLQNSVSAYYCKCPPGYSGVYCEEKVVWCKDRCRNGNKMFFWSRYIESNTYVKKFSWNSNCVFILADGNCILKNKNGNYSCECKAGYTGRFCESRLQICEFQNPCKNGGSCEAMPSSFLCKCLPGFWGHFCEFPLDPCETAVCDNGGQCISTFDGHYECRCPPGFRGKNCDIRDVSSTYKYSLLSSIICFPA